MSNKKLMLFFMASAGVLSLGANAFAQTGEVSEVVVTGSRIVRNGNQAPQPVTVATAEQLAVATPSNIPEGLNKLPEFNGSTSRSNVGNAGSPGSGNFLNLRSFGAIRTLILMDGRRVPATSTAGTVDTNTLPQMLVQRVDVVTGGASAVYGSDAVTGVVNFILDTKFNGFKAVTQAGISSRSDDKSWKVGLAGGKNLFDDRGHFEWSVEHFQTDGIKRKEDRPYGSLVYTAQGAGTVANPYRLVVNSRNNDQSYGGYVSTGPFAGQQFVSNGVLGPFNKGAATGSGGVSSGGDGVYAIDTGLASGLRTNQGFARFDYDFSDDVHFFAQLSSSESRNKNVFYPTESDLAFIYSGNAFLPTALQSQLTASNTAQFSIKKVMLDAAPASIDTLVNAMNFTTGLNGTLFGRFNWETYYTHGEGRLRIKNVNNRNNAKFYAALDAVRDSGGNIVCRVNLTNPGLYPGCVPLNLFGPTSGTAAAYDYVYEDTQFQSNNKLDDFAGNVTGDLFDLWAGPVAFAVGAEYRTQSLRQTTQTPPVFGNFTGLRNNFSASTLTHRGNVVAPTSGSMTVWETNAELAVPLLKDAPLAKYLELNGALRYADYSTTGSATTWKVGVIYQPVDSLRFRLVESRDIRSPTLDDLYRGRSQSVGGFADIHTATSSQTQSISQGNPNLVPEVARTTVAGVVFEPSFLPRFSISADFYNIYISNAIGSIGGNNAAAQAECEASNGASLFCSLYIRPQPFSDRSPANYPTAIVTQNLNVSETYTHGIDVEANYGLLLEDMNLPGRLDIRLLASFQPVSKARAFPTAQLINNAGAAGLADKRYNLNLTYTNGGFSFTSQTRYLSSQKQSGNPVLVYDIPNVKSVSYTDMAISYRMRAFGHEVAPFLTVSNIFDKSPPLFASPNFAGNPNFIYPIAGSNDATGRYYTAGMRFRF